MCDDTETFSQDQYGQQPVGTGLPACLTGVASGEQHVNLSTVAGG